MGTPEFGAIILEGLINNNYKPILVMTEPDKPVGRDQAITPPPVKVAALRYQVPVEQPENIENWKLKIRDFNPDLIIVAAYRQILPKAILEIPQYGCLNIHPSLLPKYRGPSPIQHTILNGDKETGVTIIKMTEKIDAGPIISVSKLTSQISEITAGELLKELANLGAKTLVETIPKIIEGKIEPILQDNLKATYTRIIKREDGKIDWQKPAEEIARQIRAFSPWPGAFTFWNRDKKLLRMKILKDRVYKSPSDVLYPVGKTLVVPQNEIGVQCGKDFLIIEILQIEGGKEMGADEFLRGHHDFIGVTLR